MNKTLCGIYKITCLVNSVCYIGQSTNIKRRWGVHKRKLRNGTHANSYLQNIYNKYGEENFDFKVLELCSLEKLDEREQYWIEYYGGYQSKKTCNFNSGGNKNKKCSIDTLKKLSESHKGFKVREETKRKISKSMLGKSIPKITSIGVLKIDKKGNIVKTYASLADAGRDAGIAYGSIKKKAEHSDRLYDNYYWKLIKKEKHET